MRIFNKFYICSVLLGIASAIAVSSVRALPFNTHLSPQELSQLKKGEVIIRNTGSIKDICLETDDKTVQDALKTIKDLDPAYLAEVIQVRPISGNEQLIDKLQDTLIDIPSYVGIPYWSERHQRYFDLYSEGKVISTEQNKNTTHIRADLFMSPFGTIQTDITLYVTDNFLLYRNTNLNSLHYSGIKCVKEKNMESIIIVFQSDNNWILYGLGGVEAPTVFFLKNRIEISFMNRIKTFCNFVFTKL